MGLIGTERVKGSYDLVVAGSGFGSLFFVARFLTNFPRARVLIIEKGGYYSPDWQLSHNTNSPTPSDSTYRNTTKNKPWNFTIGFGGGTNCWAGITPRLLPASFKMKSNYGVAEDWPITYQDLELYYAQAEAMLGVSGPNDLDGLYPGLTGYPLPAHRFSSVDEVMKAAQPDKHFSVPQARASVSTPTRNRCCSSNRCSLCPVNAKFTWHNGFQQLLSNDRIDILVSSEVSRYHYQNGVVQSIEFINSGIARVVKGDLFVLGCNAIQSPAILMKSGLTHPVLGRYLHEKYPVLFEVKLDGLNNYDGSTAITGMNTSAAQGDFRQDYAASLLLFCNHWGYHGMRAEPGKFRQTLSLEAYIETEPSRENRVYLDGDTVCVEHAGAGGYELDGLKMLQKKLPDILKPLPVESIRFDKEMKTLGHIQGTLRMGGNPDYSIVDHQNVHHQLRNLIVVGSSVWPSCGLANPSLTLAALSLRAADNLV